MNVLSLFDGISIAQLALKRCGIKVTNYFASEIDPKAITVAHKHFSSTQHLGDVKKIDPGNLPKIDLMIGGSPCTNLSVAGKREGVNGAQSKLFWEYVRILKAVKPEHFILENVGLTGDNLEIFNENIGCQPIILNSANFGAQRRKRMFWTNIKVNPVWFNDNSCVKDILTDDFNWIDISDKNLIWLDVVSSSNCIGGLKSRSETWRNEKPEKISDLRSHQRIYYKYFKSPTITTKWRPLYFIGDNKFRRLNCVEIERLQNLPDNYTAGYSHKQRTQMIGNGFDAKVIEYILSFI